MTATMTFTEHCHAQGIRPGVVLNSLLDAHYGTVQAIHDGDLWSDPHVVIDMSHGHGRYLIANDELPEWAIA